MIKNPGCNIDKFINFKLSVISHKVVSSPLSRSTHKAFRGRNCWCGWQPVKVCLIDLRKLKYDTFSRWLPGFPSVCCVTWCVIVTLILSRVGVIAWLPEGFIMPLIVWTLQSGASGAHDHIYYKKTLTFKLPVGTHVYNKGMISIYLCYRWIIHLFCYRYGIWGGQWRFSRARRTGSGWWWFWSWARLCCYRMSYIQLVNAVTFIKSKQLNYIHPELFLYSE